jgi:hypothetical protein
MMVAQHYHYGRPDRVTATGVPEPYFIRQMSPVDQARRTIDAFLYGIRAPGPSVLEQTPRPSDFVRAAYAQAAALTRPPQMAVPNQSAVVTPPLSPAAVPTPASLPGASPQTVVAQVESIARKITAGQSVAGIAQQLVNAAMAVVNGQPFTFNVNGQNITYRPYQRMTVRTGG